MCGCIGLLGVGVVIGGFAARVIWVLWEVEIGVCVDGAEFCGWEKSESDGIEVVVCTSVGSGHGLDCDTPVPRVEQTNQTSLQLSYAEMSRCKPACEISCMSTRSPHSEGIPQ